MDSGQQQTLGAAGTTDHESSALPVQESRRRPPVKIVLFGLVLLGLLGIVALATVREISTSSANARTARPVLAPPPPPPAPRHDTAAAGRPDSW